MENKVAVIKFDTVPMKALPSEDSLKVQIAHLSIWIEKILSLHGETSTNRLETLLPMISKSVGFLSLSDIKQAFMMYVECKLPLEPIPNYIDLILFNKIIQSYKKTRKVKKTIKEPEMTQEDKEKNIYLGCITCFDSYIQTDKIIYGYTWVYDHLDDLKLLKFTDDEKRKIMPLAKEKLIDINKETYSHSEYKSFIRYLENGKEKQAIINMAKRMMLIRFFSSLHAKDKHIKDLL